MRSNVHRCADVADKYEFADSLAVLPLEFNNQCLNMHINSVQFHNFCIFDISAKTQERDIHSDEKEKCVFKLQGFRAHESLYEM